jgi:F-type H+-transporting ATPase subunit delta
MNSAIVTTEIADPYAQALMSVAQENNLTDVFGENAAEVLAALAESAELATFVASPLMNGDVKKGVLRQAFGEAVHPIMLNFLLLLVDRGRIMLLGPVLKQFQNLLRQFKQAVLAEVTTAVALTDEQQEAVRQQVVALTQAEQVDFEITIDPELLGGVIIRVGSQVVDASLRGQLRRISLQLSSAA